MIKEIVNRRSIRKYKPDEIPTEAINKMIQSGRLAPSGKNKQPWKFLIYRKDAKRKFLLKMEEGIQSPAKVGAYLRHSEKGAFTREGYCFRSKEGWQEIYDGQELPETELGTKTFLSVRIEERDHPENGDVWIFLPCHSGELVHVWNFVSSPCLSSCRITEVSSMIPVFEEHIGPDEDIGVLNELAGKLEKMTSGERLKYKAVLEFDGWKSVERSLWLADRLNEYMFDPSQVSYGNYGRECLENLGVDCSDPAFERFDFYQYCCCPFM